MSAREAVVEQLLNIDCDNLYKLARLKSECEQYQRLLELEASKDYSTVGQGVVIGEVLVEYFTENDVCDACNFYEELQEIVGEAQESCRFKEVEAFVIKSQQDIKHNLGWHHHHESVVQHIQTNYNFGKGGAILKYQNTTRNCNLDEKGILGIVVGLTKVDLDITKTPHYQNLEAALQQKQKELEDLVKLLVLF